MVLCRTFVSAFVLLAIAGCGAVLGLGTAEDEKPNDDPGADGSTSADGEVLADGDGLVDGATDVEVDGDALASAQCGQSGSACPAAGCCSGLVCRSDTTKCGACVAVNVTCATGKECCAPLVCSTATNGGNEMRACCRAPNTACTVANQAECCSGACTNFRCDPLP